MGMKQSRLGKYELQERLGRSAVGEVWKALDTQQRRYVAINIIPVDAQTGADFTPRFYREAQMLAALRHPNIIPIQDFRMSQNGSEAYIIMDYVEGTSLADYLSATAHKGKMLASNEIVRLLAPIADALDYAHQRGVIHGALKPAAILLDSAPIRPANAASQLVLRTQAGRNDKADAAFPSPGEPKLTDFGLNSIHNPLDLPLSDVPYISPEIARGSAGTNRSDLYSLGVILYEMCTGALPFQGDTPSDILMQHIHGTPTSPALINPRIPPALTAVIMRSLARDPGARPPTATALVTTVATALNESMPSRISDSQPGRDSSRPYGTVNPPVVGARFIAPLDDSLDTMNSPTYLSQPPQQSLPKAPSVPPVVAGSNTPVLPPYPVISSSTPVLPMTPTGSASVIQTPAQAETNVPPIPTSQPTLAAPMPTTLPGPSVPPVPQQAPRETVPSPTPPARKRRPGWLYIALVAALLVVVAGSALGVYLYYTHSSPPSQATQPTIIGHAFFTSSGLLGNKDSTQGITDGLQINLQNLPDPQSGKRYYAWLLNNFQSDLPAAALGSLSLNHGKATMTYSDPQHNNLLANYGRFLVTEEDANPPPGSPSLDTNTWRYYAAFSTTPNPADTVNHYSLLDHLRHLLSQDPKLKLVGLGGGLDIWLFRNTTKILEQAGSARGAQRTCTPAPINPSCDFAHRALVRILDYLDGSTYVYVQADVPPGTPVLIDTTIARVALLEFDVVNQQPPGYLRHVGNHLRELVNSPGVTAAQRTIAIRVGQAINNAQAWLEAVHADAVMLEKMDNSQLSQPAALSLLDDMLKQANFAFAGQFDPNTSTVKEGVAQIHANLQGLATFDVTPCTINNGKNTCA